MIIKCLLIIKNGVSIGFQFIIVMPLYNNKQNNNDSRFQSNSILVKCLPNGSIVGQ